MNTHESNTIPETDACFMLSYGSGLRGCTCACSNIVSHAITCVGEFDAQGEFHAPTNAPCMKQKCLLRPVNIALEFQGLAHVTSIMLFFLLSVVFRHLDSLHPQLHHLFDITVPVVIFHAKFHNSIGVVNGTIVWIVFSIISKVIFLGQLGYDFFYLSRAVCEDYSPCVDEGVVFYSLIGLSILLLILNVWEIIVLRKYSRLLRKARARVKKLVHGK